MDAVGPAAIRNCDVVIDDHRDRRGFGGPGDCQCQQETPGGFLVFRTNLDNVDTTGNELAGDFTGITPGEVSRVNEPV